MEKLKETDWAYLAGFADGEARFDIYHKKMESTKRGYVREYIFSFCNTNTEVLDEISAMFDHACWNTTHKRKADCPWKLGHSLHFNHTMQRAMFPMLLPHLKVKKRTVELMLESMTLMKTLNTEERERQLVKIDLELKKIHDEQLCGSRNRDYSILLGLAKKFGLTY